MFKELVMKKYYFFVLLILPFLFANEDEIKKQQDVLANLQTEISILKKKATKTRLEGKTLKKKGKNTKGLLSRYRKYLKKYQKLEVESQKIKSKIASLLLKPEDKEILEKIHNNKQLKTNFQKILTANKCADCHKNEVKVWKGTPHHTTFNTLHKRKNAKIIQAKLKLKGGLKRSGVCVQCHYTQKNVRGKPKAISGVSCESCHGAAKDWVDSHSNKNIPKMERRKSTIPRGMNNPDDIYLIAQNCYQCHSIPNEDLINIGGHQPGRPFEFVRWSQGTMRHNFVRTDNKKNAKTGKKRLRIMFVTGAMLDLEYSIRGLSLATKRAKYYYIMRMRANTAFARLLKIQKITKGIPEVNELLALFKSLNFQNRLDLQKAADYITLKAQKFTKNNDDSKLVALDSVLPKKEKYK